MEKVELKVSELKTSYRNFSVSNISFNLVSGDILGLVGRSGSGKSTILKTIIGEKRRDKGFINVYIDGKSESISDHIGYSPQENSLYQFLTLEENITTFGKLYNVKNPDLKTRMDFLLKRLDLIPSKKKKIRELSGGMQKRADLAVALIHSPRIIILDEPFTGLDISLQKFIWNLLVELSKHGRIIIISSHMLDDIHRYCNKYGLVERGNYYGTNKILNSLKHEKKNLETFLEKRFTHDLINRKND